MKVQLHSFMALDEGGWLTPRPCALPPGKRRVPIVTGSWVGITADMAGAENLPPSLPDGNEHGALVTPNTGTLLQALKARGGTVPHNLNPEGRWE